MKLIFLLLLTLITIKSGNAIIIRHDVDDAKYIERAKRFVQVCHFEMGEGTLIDQRWILTAGHLGYDLNNMLARGRSPEVTCKGKTYHVEKVVMHPGFKSLDEGLANDIALVRIKETITDVVPASIDYQKSEINLAITVVGRGDIGTGLTGPQKWDKITRAATNTVDNVEATWLIFDFDAPGSEGVTEFEGISGPGDSGGPAFYEENNKLYVIGVSSFQRGQEKFGRGHYGVTEYYARVSNYRSWIAEVLKDI